MRKLVIISDGSINLGTRQDEEKFYKLFNILSNKLKSSENIFCFASASKVNTVEMQESYWLSKIGEKIVNPVIGRQFGSDGHYDVAENEKKREEVFYAEENKEGVAMNFANYIKSLSLNDEIMGVIYFSINPVLGAMNGTVESILGDIPYFCINLGKTKNSFISNYIYVKNDELKGMCEALEEIMLLSFEDYKKTEELSATKEMPIIYETGYNPLKGSAIPKENVFKLILRKIKEKK